MTIPANLDQAEANNLLVKLTAEAKNIHSRCQAAGKFLGSVPASSGDVLEDVAALASYGDQGRQLLGESPLSDQLVKESVRPATPTVPQRPLTATERVLLAASQADGGEKEYVAGLLSNPNLNWTQRVELARQFRDKKRSAAKPPPTPVPAGRALSVTEKCLVANGLPLDSKVKMSWTN